MNSDEPKCKRVGLLDHWNAGLRIEGLRDVSCILPTLQYMPWSNMQPKRPSSHVHNITGLTR